MKRKYLFLFFLILKYVIIFEAIKKFRSINFKHSFVNDSKGEYVMVIFILRLLKAYSYSKETNVFAFKYKNRENLGQVLNIVLGKRV